MPFYSSETSFAEGLLVGSVCQQLDIRVITLCGSLSNGPGSIPAVRALCSLKTLSVTSVLFEYGFLHVSTSKREIPKLKMSAFGS